MASDGGHLAVPAPAGGLWGQFYEGLGYLAGLILAIMAGAVFLQVVLRYAAGLRSTGSTKCRAISFVWWSCSARRRRCTTASTRSSVFS